MNLPVEIHPEALQEAKEAREWYERRSPKSAARFMAEFDRGVLRISETPQSYPRHSNGTRFYKMRRFPYLLIYRELADHITIFAVTHGRRRPGYWKRRLKS